ncbi:DUF3772 domain-containing protein [Eoetvoesiella caeni]
MPFRRCFNSARLPRLRAGIALVFALMLFAGQLLDAPLAAAAPDTADAQPADIAVSLDAARSQIDKIQKRLNEKSDVAPTDAQLVELRTSAQEAQSQAESAAAAVAPQLSSVQARVAQLGAPAPGSHEAPDLQAQRKQLAKNQATLDSQLKLARLIAVEAGQIIEQVTKLRRQQFQAQMGERAASVLGGPFWLELAAEWPQDKQRITPLLDELREALVVLPGYTQAFVVLASLFLLWLSAAIRKVLLRLTAEKVAPGRLRRSLYAVTVVLLTMATPMLIVQVWQSGIARHIDTGLSESMVAIFDSLMSAAAVGGVCAGLGYALLVANRPSWRLVAISDTVASGLRWLPVGFAVPAAFSWMTLRLAALANVSLAASVALDCLMSFVIGIVIALAMIHWRHLRRRLKTEGEEGFVQRPMPFWGTVLTALIWAALIAGFVCLLLGYVALGGFIIRQLIWSILILAAAYLLSALIDDGCAALLHIIDRNAAQTDAAKSSARSRSQAAVLLAGLGRLAVYALALILLIVPFGEGPSEWARRAGYLYEGIPVGEMHIRPTSIMLALAVLVLGLIIVKLLKHWLADRYLPTTALDPGMRLSAATLFSYAGYVIVASLTMTAVGIGLERVAWVASALSVGIGFGLQAVVQNFVSGLILLAERPVKVGDWVSLGGVEGDIRRINVRATEIQMGDRSTLIVPNSEFITKVVRNVTHANPFGRVQFVLSMPVSTDVEVAGKLMRSALEENSDVLADPEPSVLLDSVTATGIVFKLTGYIKSPRFTSEVRSALLFALLQQLKDAGLPLVTPASIVVTDEAGRIQPALSSAAPPPGGAPA